jgi:hypothetical protein
MTTSPVPTAVRPPTAPASRYAGQVSGLLLTAFGLSAAYTVWTTATGLVSDGFTATEPGVWAFYAVMVAVSVAVRSDRPAAWWTLSVLLPLLLLVGIFVYPSTFTPEHQTPLGWFENDVYLGLLMVATYLTVQRLRRRRLEP